MNTTIIETTEHGEMPIDIYQKLANNRLLFINTDIDDRLATDIIATLLLHDSQNSEEKITLFINCHGGDIRNILMIYDTIKMIKSPVETVCLGTATEEAIILLCGGTKGMRFATKNSIISVGPLVNDHFSVGNLTDAKKMLELHSRDSKTMLEIIANSCDKTVKQITLDFDRKTYLTSQKALKYGLIDKVVGFSK